MQDSKTSLLDADELASDSKSSAFQQWLERLPLLLIAGILLIWLTANGTLSGLLTGEISLNLLWGRFQTLTTIFLGIFIEAAAFLLLGVLMSAVIQVFVTPDALERWIPKNRVGATIIGSLMGLIFPVCECGSVPAARRLISKGAPLPLGIAFLLSAPVINPVVIASTWEAFGGDPWIVGGRIGLTLLMSGVVALVFSFYPAPLGLLTPATADAVMDCEIERLVPKERPTWNSRLRSIAEHSASEFFEMGQFVVLGAFLAALAQTVIPQEVLLSIGSTPVSSVIVMMALAVVLSICSTVDAFVALGFANTFGTGSILAFLVYGPMIDIKAVLLFTTTLTRRAVTLLVVLVTLMSLLASIWVNLNVG